MNAPWSKEQRLLAPITISSIQGVLCCRLHNVTQASMKHILKNKKSWTSRPFMQVSTLTCHYWREPICSTHIVLVVHFFPIVIPPWFCLVFSKPPTAANNTSISEHNVVQGRKYFTTYYTTTGYQTMHTELCAVQRGKTQLVLNK
jgi:hypothetical protein